MGVLKKIFGKADKLVPSKNAVKIIDFLGCNCEYFPRSASNQALIEKYFEEHKRWRKEIILDGKTKEQIRAEARSNACEDGKRIIRELI